MTDDSEHILDSALDDETYICASFDVSEYNRIHVDANDCHVIISGLQTLDNE